MYVEDEHVDNHDDDHIHEDHGHNNESYCHTNDDLTHVYPLCFDFIFRQRYQASSSQKAIANAQKKEKALRAIQAHGFR